MSVHCQLAFLTLFSQPYLKQQRYVFTGHTYSNDLAQSYKFHHLKNVSAVSGADRLILLPRRGIARRILSVHLSVCLSLRLSHA